MAASDRYIVENLLRPPVEFFAACSSAVIGFIAAAMPAYLLMTRSVAYTVAGMLMWHALWRARDGWQIWTYHRNLVRLPFYGLTADEIPVSDKVLFLGKGFWWDQRHTQRLIQAEEPENRHYLDRGQLYRWARHVEIAWERRPLLREVAKLIGSPAWWNPFRPDPPVGGLAALHGVGLYEQEIDICQVLSERVGHTGVIGTTRVGKTRLAEILITQDIRRGDITIVLDPKGDAELMRRTWWEAKKAGRPCYIFHLGFPHISARYNAIGSFTKITEVATRTTDPLPDQGNSAAFKEFAWRFVNIIARAVVALGQRPDYNIVSKYITDIEPLLINYAKHHLAKAAPAGWAEEVAAIAEQLNDRNLTPAYRGRDKSTVALVQWLRQNTSYEDTVLRGLRSAFDYDKTYFDKIVSSLGPLLEKLTTGKVAELIAPDYFDLNDTRPVFDWLKVIRQRAVVYIGLDALSDNVVSSAVGAAMFSDLCSTAGYLYKFGRADGLPELDGTSLNEAAKLKTMPRINIHGDEFNEIMSNQVIPMLNKAGGADFQMTLYSQTLSDIMARVNDAAKTGQVLGNLNTLIMLRVKEKETAEYFCDQLPEYSVSELMAVSGVNDSAVPGTGGDFTSKNEDRLSRTKVPALHPSHLMRLPKGQAFALLDGGRLAKLRLPLPLPETGEMPQSIEAMAAHMRSVYQTSESWFNDLVPREA